MKRLFKILVRASLLFTGIPCTNAQIIIHDLTTGISNSTGLPIPYGSADDTWQRRSGITSYTPVYVCDNLNGAWGVNSCGRWITPVLDGTQPSINPGSGFPTGLFVYRTTFSSPSLCQDPAVPITVNFSYLGGDNNINNFDINGHLYTLQPSPANDFNPLIQNVSFTIDPSHLNSGLNTVSIGVRNTDSWTGLFICGNISRGYCSSPAPMDASSFNNSSRLFGDELFDVFPNPSNGAFTILLKKPSKGYIIISDIIGRKIKEASFSTEVRRYDFDLTTMPKGLYIITFKTDTYVQMKNVSIN